MFINVLTDARLHHRELVLQAVSRPFRAPVLFPGCGDHAFRPCKQATQHVTLLTYSFRDICSFPYRSL